MSDVLIMNKAHMDTLLQRFRQKSDQVEQLRNEITQLLAGTTWDGARARRFRSEWEGTFAPSLARLEAALTENANFLNHERTNAVSAMD